MPHPFANTLDVQPIGDRELKITRTFDAPRALVFDAHTIPALVKRWLLGPGGWTMPVCEIDLRPGGKYRYVWRHEAKGMEMGMGGTYKTINRPETLTQTALFDEDWTGGETLETTTFLERDGVTNYTLLVLYASPSARENALKTGMIDGMSAGYDRLDTVLATDSA